MATAELDLNFIPSLYKPSSLLPIARHKRALLYLVEKYPVTIVVGQTGSGKTTQLPQYLHEAGWTKHGKMIACTQPRRVAATTVATRVAEEMGCSLGEQVGYSIRFEDMTSPRTCIKYLTDGLLLRECLVDPLLSHYSVIMVDEAHERSLSTDILLGLLKKIRKKRKDLRIIISSATLQAEEFVQFFAGGEQEPRKGRSDAKLKEKIKEVIKREREGESGYSRGGMEQEIARVISLEGRAYPVDILYLEQPTDDYVEKAIRTVFEIHLKEGDGDILVFLSGREEIDHCVNAIAERSATLHPRTPKLIPLPLYAGLTMEQQMFVFESVIDDSRKVIFSTNIAEASITIDGIVYVVDSGFVKIRAYNPQSGIETLTATPISRASAIQRSGRAGRTRPGKCYRLYTEQSYNSLSETSIPEIQRGNLAPALLQLKALGIDNIVRFNFVSPPPAELVIKALELLYSLGALDDYARLTVPFGQRLAEIPVPPMLGKILLTSVQFGCTEQILSIAAMVTVESVFLGLEDEKKAAESAKRKFAVEEGDHLTLLNVYHAFVTHGHKSPKWSRDHYLNHRSMMRAVSVRSQLRRYLERFGIRGLDSPSPSMANISLGERIRRCLTTGYFAHAARMQPDGTFVTVSGGLTLWAHPSSVMFNRRCDWVIFHEVIETGHKTFIKDITTIRKDWLLEYAPGFYEVRGNGMPSL